MLRVQEPQLEGEKDVKVDLVEEEEEEEDIVSDCLALF